MVKQFTQEPRRNYLADTPVKCAKVIQAFNKHPGTEYPLCRHSIDFKQVLRNDFILWVIVSEDLFHLTLI